MPLRDTARGGYRLQIARSAACRTTRRPFHARRRQRNARRLRHVAAGRLHPINARRRVHVPLPIIPRAAQPLAPFAARIYKRRAEQARVCRKRDKYKRQRAAARKADGKRCGEAPLTREATGCMRHHAARGDERAVDVGTIERRYGANRCPFKRQAPQLISPTCAASPAALVCLRSPQPPLPCVRQ